MGIGIGLFVLSYFALKFFNATLDWLDKSGFAGASWLGLATWELTIGTVVICALWIISLLGLPCRWHNRFRAAAMYYAWGFLGLGGGVAAVMIPGFISMWSYKHGIWPVGMIFRLVEIGAAIAVLFGLVVWLIAMVYGMFIPRETEKDAAFRFRLPLFIGWICLISILSASFGYYTWRYSLGSTFGTATDEAQHRTNAAGAAPSRPSSRTATDQAQLEDCATAVVGCVHFSASDDPNDLASVAKGKQALKDMIQDYDKNSLDEICSLVDQSLQFERSLQNDMLAYMEESSHTSETSKFRICERTRQILDKLPNKLRTFLEISVTEMEKLDSSTVNPPKNWREIMDKATARIWSIYGQTYSELLGRPMPAPTD